jgi:hypothetical protein
MTRLRASEQLRELPRWAVLERTLFDLLEEGWREFERRFCELDGRLRYGGRMHGRDGVDDFYEPFFNWPALYRLGGSDELLAAAKHHWEGVTLQLTEFGFVADEYEVGYDWFHQAESLGLLLGICAADPADAVFRDRARRFAGYYLPGSPTGNYDAATRTIVAPHTGSQGPRWGVGEDWDRYSAEQPGMEPYGLPLHDVDGIRSWDDLRVPGAASAMGAAMQTRMGRGDTVVNLAATTLAVNAWLYDHEPAFAEWALEYIDAWRERAAANRGALPDNVGPTGAVGELHGGAWWGGHYGWTWPHGLHSIGAAATVASLNAVVLTGELDRLDLARDPLDTVLGHAEVSDRIAERGSLGPGWAEKLGATPDTRELLVPYRHGPDGWFDFHPVPLSPLLWLGWVSDAETDRDRVARVHAASESDWSAVRWFRDKEEQGHEAPWHEYLEGRNIDYPERALEMAIGQVLRQRALIAEAPDAPEDGDIHFWQRLNPVVTEVLTQLVTGAPPAVYYGGLTFARLAVGDADRSRPGLPPGVAMLVSGIRGDDVTSELVNTGDTERVVVLTAGAFGEDTIDEVTYSGAAPGYPGDPHSYAIPPTVPSSSTHRIGSSRLEVVLPPRTRIALQLTITRRANVAAHQTYIPTKQEKA